jgi:hypothetical protein
MNRWLIAFVLMALTPSLVRSDQAGFSPYRIVSADGKYVFVMLNMSNGRSYGNHGYPSNGLYLNDGSKTPLWTVDWIGRAYLPADGVHVVKHGGWSSQFAGYNTEAITFFANGKPIKSYRVSDLIDFPSLLPHTISHYVWDEWGLARYEGQSNTPVLFVNDVEGYYSRSVIFNELAHTMSLKTLQGDSFVFDLNTGDIVEARRPVRRIVLVALTIGLLAYCIYVLRAAKRPRITFLQSSLRLLIYSVLLSAIFVSAVLFFISQARTAEHPLGHLFEGIFRFLWYWPVRYIEISRETESVNYPFPEVQTFVIWMLTFLGIGTANECVVRALKRIRERRETAAESIA